MRAKNRPANSDPWSAQPGPQLQAIRKHWVTELFFGGAVGGGKSDFLLGDFGQDVPEYGAAWRGVLFRKTYPQLDELIQRSKTIYPAWFPGCNWRASDNAWCFPNGAELKMRHMEDRDGWMNYWGHQYTWIGWDELPSWPDLSAYNKMKARLRSAHGVPNMRIRSTGNPGGPGHHAVKQYFSIDTHPMGGEVFGSDDGTTRLFVKSRLADNRILLDNDPGYQHRLRGLGSEALVRAWLDGDWDVVEGAYFDCWRADLHVLRPIELPEHWTRFASFDWGSARPFSVGWWAVASEDFDAGATVVPRGSLIRSREWYGAKSANVGLKLTVEEVAEGILKREGGQAPEYRVADPAIYISDGGPSMAERFAKAGVAFRRGDNKRVPGWDQVRRRLVGENGKPLMYIFSTCADTIRTLPALQHDTNKPEDVDTDNEDHAGDDVRLACMSRPLLAKLPVKKDMTLKPEQTYDDLLKYKKPTLPRKRI